MSKENQVSRVRALAARIGVNVKNHDAVLARLARSIGFTDHSLWVTVSDDEVIDRLLRLEDQHPDLFEAPAARKSTSQPPNVIPGINENIRDPDVRAALGSLDLNSVPADRRAGVLAQITREVEAKRNPTSKVQALTAEHAARGLDASSIDGVEKVRQHYAQVQDADRGIGKPEPKIPLSAIKLPASEYLSTKPLKIQEGHRVKAGLKAVDEYSRIARTLPTLSHTVRMDGERTLARLAKQITDAGLDVPVTVTR